MTRLLLALVALAVGSPLAARESLGVFEQWGAFRDEQPRRCYAIGKAEGARADTAFATIATWPDHKVRGQLHLVLSRPVAEGGQARLYVGGRRFALIAKGRNAWGKDAQEDAAIIAALRSAPRMRIAARSETGVAFTDRYALAGVATAIDAAVIGCARRR